MTNKEISAKLETIAQSLYSVRLPVQEANAYSTVLAGANRIAELAKKMEEEAEREAKNQPE